MTLEKMNKHIHLPFSFVPHATSKGGSILYFLLGVTLVVGFILSILSWLRICSGACGESHNYRFFGMMFEPIGLLFFTLAIVAYFCLSRGLIAFLALGTLLAGALGSETVFIWIQKYVIGHWCPVCLSIAACVAIATALFYTLQIKENYFKDASKFVKSILFLAPICSYAFGVMLAAYGVAKPENSFADGTADNESPLFGNIPSIVEVYVVTDWFCPECQSLEPKMKLIYPLIMNKARLIFIDKAIHPETMNYIPYNLSFMLKDKKQYFNIRGVFIQLAKNKIIEPTVDEVQSAVSALGVTYQPLNFAEVHNGVKFFDDISLSFEINQTPTIVVANRKAVTSKKLVGQESITEETVLKLIEEMSH